MTGIAGPIVEVFSDLLQSFGLPPVVATLLCSISFILILFALFIHFVSKFNIDEKGKQYLVSFFLISLAVLGLIPWWTIVILGLIGLVVVFFQKIQGVGG